MRVVVFGAGGGVGQLVVQAAVERGDEVVAAARSHVDYPAGVDGRTVDVRQSQAVDDALVNVDAVIWCVGVTKRSGGDVGRVGMAHVIESASRHGARRVVGVSGAGVTLPGDSKSAGAKFVSALTRRLARNLVEDKEGEHQALNGSTLDWTQVRPPRLSNAEASGRWRLTNDAPGLKAAAVPRADLAEAMLNLAHADKWLSQAPFIVTDKK